MILFFVRDEITDFFNDINMDLEEQLLTIMDTGLEKQLFLLLIIIVKTLQCILVKMS
jgi:hypothetical protein